MRTAIFSNTVVTFGLATLLYSSALMFQHYNPARLQFNGFASHAAYADAAVYPVNIVIKSAGIETPVIPVQKYDNRWTLTAKGAAYLESSPVPGMVGNSIIYGHNWTNIFGKLMNVKPGDFIEVYLNTKERRMFGVTSTAVVDPNDIEVLKPSTDRHLTLYTCIGFLDSKRFVVSATLQSEVQRVN